MRLSALYTNPIFIILIVGFAVYFNALYCEALSGDDALIIDYQDKVGRLGCGNVASLLDKIAYDFLGGDNPVSYHFVNIVLHLAVCVLLLYFLKIFFSPLPSLYGALIFTILPIHTENVTWIAGKIHILIGLSFLSTFLLFHYKKYLWALLVFTLGIYPGFNQISIVNLWVGLTPIFIGAYLLIYKKYRELWKLIPFFIIFGIIAALFIFVVLERINYTAAGYKHGVNLWANFIYSVFSHFWLMIYPANLMLYHENVLVTFSVLAWSSAVILLLGGFSVYLYKKAKPLLLGLILFFLFLSPTYSPFPVGWVIAERYAYVPSILLSIVVAYAISSKYKDIVVLICLTAIVFYFARTIDRNADYKTSGRFCRVNVMANPLSSKARNDLGVVYAQESNVIRALQEFGNALRIEPDFKAARTNLELVEKALLQKIKIKY
jgi:hypothetical protein